MPVSCVTPTLSLIWQYWDPHKNTPFFSLIFPTFPSLYLSWACHYWALRWGFLEALHSAQRSQENLEPHWSLYLCLMLLIIFVARPRKAASLETQEHHCDWSHTHRVEVTCDHRTVTVQKRKLQYKCSENPSPGWVLTKAKRSFWFLLWGSYAHLSQIKNKRNMNTFITVL